VPTFFVSSQIVDRKSVLPKELQNGHTSTAKKAPTPSVGRVAELEKEVSGICFDLLAQPFSLIPGQEVIG